MPAPLKPPALRPGDAVRILSLASPVEESRVDAGCKELARLGYKLKLDRAQVLARDGFFAGGAADRLDTLTQALGEANTRAIFCTRGGYGSNYLLDGLGTAPASPKILLGYSDITSLHIFLWQKFGWVTLYGPMVASGFDHGANSPKGYDRDSLLHALAETKTAWSLDLQAEPLVPGSSGEGVLVGGCLTLIQTTLGTPWELDTRGAILVLEDCDMKPYQLDRALMHLKQAGKLRDLRGIILGDFPGCDAPAGSETVKDIARRILEPLRIPVAFGASIGHTDRPMLTLPLGVRARLSVSAASGGSDRTRLDILEPAVM
jgi:muramoyltetrapeptide carboxypeptidase